MHFGPSPVALWSAASHTNIHPRTHVRTYSELIQHSARTLHQRARHSSLACLLVQIEFSDFNCEAEMAAAAASFVAMSLGTSAALRTATTQNLSVARFNGLKACPVLRQSAVISRPVAIRSLTISASAKPDTLSAVQGIIAQQLAVGVEKVLPEAKFADLGADSLDTVEIIMALEETFKITLDEEGAQKISTVQEAADLIQTSIE